MNTLMESMKTSSGLTLSLRWKNSGRRKKNSWIRGTCRTSAKMPKLCVRKRRSSYPEHFRSKIEEARKSANDLGNVQSFHAIMRNVLDYRQWFEFQLECQKQERRKGTDRPRILYFSGGEKAMSMYVPLFSAVVAKYAGQDRMLRI